MTAKDDCYMLSNFILSAFGTPISIILVVQLYPYLITGSMTMPEFEHFASIIGMGFLICLIAGILMAIGHFVDGNYDE